MISSISKEYILSLPKIVTSEECWIKEKSSSYPTITINNQVYILSRLVAHLWHNLDLNDPRQLACHRCDNKPCFNPEHIYSGTFSSNLNDAVDSRAHGQTKRTHCKLGHLLDGIKVRSNGNSERYCKKCQRLANIKHRRH
jgi:hypothetical protein